MASGISIRPRLLVVSLATALVVSVAGVWIASRLASGGESDPPIDAQMDKPGEYVEPLEEGESSAGDELPDVELLDVDGEPVQTSSLTGQPLVVNIWHSNCAPCVREMPALAEVDAEYDDDVVRFVGINPLDDVDTMLEYADDRGVEYELYRDEVSTLVDAVRVVGYPTTLFVDADGVIVEHHTSEIDADGVRDVLEEML